ncbi:MAG: ribosome biogenesis GTPase Der [Ruminococcaceae bacterium]|nr:ribosome biogenesis GTPase Der [Oscillospiraceae bacterium]
MSKPLVAIVGRPNVGKSLLFNRLAGQRLSIVEDTPGVTRDRLYAECEWAGRKFDIVDTGGIEPTTDNEILLFMREQANIAINAADVIVLVTEIGTGVTAADKEVAHMLKRSHKPVVLVVNKMDNPSRVDPTLYEFYSLGLGDPMPLSAVHGHGTGDMLDECLKYFPPESEDDEEDDRINVAIIGKPNVGKSSLTNLITGEQRVIVSDVAGTTRDAVDTKVDNRYGKYNFIDTAGIRRKSKVDDRIEKFSVMRAQLAIERADVCLIMIDAREGVTEQDTKIAGLAHEAGKASIVIVNKWDLVEKETGTMEKMRKDVMRDLSFMSYAPVLFISAMTGQRVDRIYELINFVNDQAAMRITTGMLNNVLADAQARVQPPSDKGRRLKIYYMTQTGVKPPQFVVFCNSRELFHFSYQRYLENQIRATFGLEGTPIRMVIRQKGDKDE